MKSVFGIILIILFVASMIAVGYILIKKSMKPPVVYESEVPFLLILSIKLWLQDPLHPEKKLN
jgi:hypothetical protein